MTILGIFLLNQIRTGGDRRYLELMELLAERGNNIIVIMNTYLNYKPKFFTEIRIPVKYVLHRFPPASYLFKNNVRKYFNKIMSSIENEVFNSINFIHIHGDTHLKTAIYLKKRLKKPLFYASRCNDIDRAHIIRKNMGLRIFEYIFSLIYEPINIYREKQIAKYSDLVTFQNSADRNLFILRNKISPSKTIVIPGNIGLPRCIPYWKNKNNSKTVKNILCVGITSKSKGFIILLRVLMRLKQRGFEFLHFTLLGKPEKQIFTLIKNSYISEMITFNGFVNPFPFYANHDLLFYPTLYDAYPDTVLEALHTDCPVLASARGGLPEMLHYSELLFDPDNIEQITDRIIKCTVDPVFYDHIRKLCYERASIHRFNWAARFENAIIGYKTVPLIQKSLCILGIFLINEIRTGGDRDYIELLELFAQHGNKVFVILNTNLDYSPRFITPIYIDIKYTRRGFPPASFLFKLNVMKEIKYILQRIKTFPHFIHIHGDIYLKTALYLKRLFYIPLFYASRSNDIDRAHILRRFSGYTISEYLFSILYEPINHFREKQIAKYANLLTFLNPYDKDRFIFRTGHKGKGISIIPNHIGYPHCMDETKETNTSSCISKILYVGSLSPSKGILYLLEAIALLKKEGFNLHYHILGRLENDRKAVSLINKLDIEDDISIEGFQNPFPYYKNCDLLICPTLYDGFSNVIVEALHAGCPVLASNLAGPSYILKYNDILFQPGNSVEIAKKIKQNIINNESYQNIRRLCHERAEVFRFNWAESFEQMMIDYLLKTA